MGTSQLRPAALPATVCLFLISCYLVSNRDSSIAGSWTVDGYTGINLTTVVSIDDSTSTAAVTLGLVAAHLPPDDTLPPIATSNLTALGYDTRRLDKRRRKDFDFHMTHERYRLPKQPAAMRNVTYNIGTVCEYTVDNLATESLPLSANWLRQCGGAVRGRPALWPSNEPDPMLQCSPAASHIYLFSFGWIGGYRQEQSWMNWALRKHKISVLWAFQDFGCHTAYRGPDDVLVGYLLRGSLNYALTVRPSPQLVDVGSQLMTYSYRTGDIHRWWWNDRAVPALKRASTWAAALHGDNSSAPRVLETARAKREPEAEPDPDMGFVIVGKVPSSPIRYVDVRGDAIVISTRYPAVKLGQIFMDTLTSFARIWSSGLLDRLHNATVVLFRSEDGTDHQLRSWIEPFLDGRPVIWIKNNEVARIERPWFAHVQTTIESAEPCMGNFVANYLLPRALRIVRADPTFQFGNETTRNDSSVSDREWASTFPRKLAVFKTSSSGRSVRGVFRLSAYSLGMVLNASFVVAGDKMPFPHRFALLNFLDVLLVPFGSTLSTFTMAWGGNTAAHRPGVKLRVITLMEQGYHFERFLWAPRRCRLGKQLGLEVLVSEFMMAGPRNTWQKGIVLPRGQHTLDVNLKPQHLEFAVHDCTTNPTLAKDFHSQELPYDPLTWEILRPEFFNASNSTWRLIPRYGQRCPLYWV
jgi:hypothetical protein